MDERGAPMREAAAESAASAHVTIRGLTKHFADAVVYLSLIHI